MSKTNETKQTTRLKAFMSKNLSIDKTKLKEDQIQNVIEAAQIHTKLKLADFNEKIEAAAKIFVENPTESNLNAVAQIMQDKEDYMVNIEAPKKVLNYLAETVEVEDKHHCHCDD